MVYSNLKVIPMPKEVVGADENGNYSMVSIPCAVYSERSDWAALCVPSFTEYAKKLHGLEIVSGSGGIQIFFDHTVSSDGYRLEIDEGGAKVYASESEGVYYSLATLLQLMKMDGENIILPMVKIKDAPDCGYRSFMVDLARQWYDFEYVLRYVDLCYLYKLKYLHLHFIDTQSYTLPSAVYPKVSTEGRHYTREQIDYLNHYAMTRGVELIPEIEVPGHAAAMVNAYPEIFANTLIPVESGDADPTAFRTDFKNNIICVGKPGVMDALKKLFVEIIEMFPHSRYLHIGGDEAEINDWDKCVDCRRYMAKHGIGGVHALYTHFTKLATDMVLELGKTPIVWEGFPREGAEEISRDIVVIAWESYYHLAPELLEEGFNIINASWQPMYVTPGLRWTPENIMAWNIYNWQHWWPKSAARLNPIHVQPTKQVLGGMLCAWENTFPKEIKYVRENLAALSARTWNIRRYEDDEQFREKLNAILPLVDKLVGTELK